MQQKNGHIYDSSQVNQNKHTHIYMYNYYAALHLMYRALFLIELEFINTYICGEQDIL